MREIPVGTKLWKKCNSCDGEEELIVELKVTEPGICARWDAKRDPSTTTPARANYKNKCRVRAAKVISIVGVDSEEHYDIAYSSYHTHFEYRVGNEVRPMHPFEEGDWACGSGIHGFETREQAEDYSL